MHTLWQDLRYGARLLLKQPRFTLVAVITLALGSGANTAIYSLVDKLLVRSLAVREPERLVMVNAESLNPKFVSAIFSYADYADYRDRNEVFSGLIAHRQTRGTLGAGSETESLDVEMVSGNYFDVLGIGAARGRTLGVDDDRTPGAHPVAVLSHGFWQRRFGGANEIIGQPIVINKASYTVVGVAAPGYSGMRLENPTDVWVPVMMAAQIRQMPVELNERDNAWLELMGRVKPGLTLEQARQGMDVVVRQISAANLTPSELSQPYQAKRILFEPGGRGASALRREYGQALKLLMAAVGVILLIACANVASLLLARARARRKEMAIRAALGAGRMRLVRQLLTENLLLSLLGGALGLVLAPWLTAVLLSFQKNVLTAPTSLSEAIDSRVLLFTLAVSILSGIICSLAPALSAAQLTPGAGLKEAGAASGSGGRFFTGQGALVTAQVALSVVMLTGAGLLVRSLQKMLAVDLGFAAKNVLMAPIELPDEGYTKAKGVEFHRQLVERVSSLTGVAAVSTAMTVPFSGVPTQPVALEAYQTKSGEHLAFETNNVGPRYHELMGIPILQGRGFTEQDNAASPRVAIINQTLARLYFPDQNPLGKRIWPDVKRTQPPFEIVGVVGDSQFSDLTSAPRAHFDVPLLQRGSLQYFYLQIRTAAEPMNLAEAVRQAARQLDSQMKLGRLSTLEEDLLDSIAAPRMATTLTSLMGLLAGLIAVLGLYSAMTYRVAQSTQEIGIRLALGAQGGDVLKLVIGQGLILTLVGLVIGSMGAFGLTRFMTSQLFGVTATDPLTFVTVPALLLVVALLACYLPARRAAKVDPMVALRYE